MLLMKMPGIGNVEINQTREGVKTRDPMILTQPSAVKAFIAANLTPPAIKLTVSGKAKHYDMSVRPAIQLTERGRAWNPLIVWGVFFRAARNGRPFRFRLTAQALSSQALPPFRGTASSRPKR